MPCGRDFGASWDLRWRLHRCLRLSQRQTVMPNDCRGKSCIRPKTAILPGSTAGTGAMWWPESTWPGMTRGPRHFGELGGANASSEAKLDRMAATNTALSGNINLKNAIWVVYWDAIEFFSSQEKVRWGIGGFHQTKWVKPCASSRDTPESGSIADLRAAPQLG